ncbi:MAG: DNA polymerase III, subunit gamma and tau, partial [Cyclobacteriaceae bacterium]|nr:DNA polymerase III, subunit gamma and tau [Cyclobacteriaceae bacterium]
QDERTVKLLEVPDTIRKKYVEQSKAAPYALLLSWLNIGNQCDINYKMSRNQRLLVELALMKMAHVRSVVSASPETASAAPAPPAALKKKLS